MNITLIGMAGVGKSVIGRGLAKRLHYRFIDTDLLIQRKTGLRLQKIIDTLGEKEFLKIEEQMVTELDLDGNCVVSPGGSVVYSAKAMRFLKKRSTIVFLDAPFRDIRRWITDKDTRGIVDLGKGLKAVFSERRPLYKKYSDFAVRCYAGSGREATVERILKKWRSRNKG
jgi:shikimate kinase